MSSVSRVVAEMGYHVLFAAALLLLATGCVLGMSDADREACTKEAVANSSVSEEDRMKTQKIMVQTFKEMHERFRKGRREERHAFKGGDMIAEKVDADEGIKDKEAAKKYAKAFKMCLMSRTRILDRMCPAAKEVNKDRLTEEELRKMMGTMRSVYHENKGGGQITDDVLEKKLGEALGSEEKGKAALEVHKALRECRKNRKGKKPEDE